MELNPYRLLDLLPAARNMMDYCQLQRDEHVSVFATPSFRRWWSKRYWLRWKSGAVARWSSPTRPAGLSWRKGDEPPRAYKAAMYASDVVIQLKSVEAQTFPRVQETAMIEHDIRHVARSAGQQHRCPDRSLGLIPL